MALGQDKQKWGPGEHTKKPQEYKCFSSLVLTKKLDEVETTL